MSLAAQSLVVFANESNLPVRAVAALCELRLIFAAVTDRRYSHLASNFVNKKNNFPLPLIESSSFLISFECPIQPLGL
jgi:hypothetical protein